MLCDNGHRSNDIAWIPVSRQRILLRCDILELRLSGDNLQSMGYKPNGANDGANPFIVQLLTAGTQSAAGATQLNAALCRNRTANGSDGACEEAQGTLERLTTQAPRQASPGRLASVTPDFAITLGEVAMETTISGATMKPVSLPWSVDIVAGRGCDFMLQDRVSAMAPEGLIKPLKAGKHVH
ncbi:hypothetical protein F5Y05DRAFT_74713 [Hypoxylon sp. FL0543]|nr:hypothetical protein F5Y05DRAFT_74713 [Hypoxylon sp. FL0543]